MECWGGKTLASESDLHGARQCRRRDVFSDCHLRPLLHTSAQVVGRGGLWLYRSGQYSFRCDEEYERFQLRSRSITTVQTF